MSNATDQAGTGTVSCLNIVTALNSMCGLYEMEIRSPIRDKNKDSSTRKTANFVRTIAGMVNQKWPAQAMKDLNVLKERYAAEYKANPDDFRARYSERIIHHLSELLDYAACLKWVETGCREVDDDSGN